MVNGTNYFCCLTNTVGPFELLLSSFFIFVLFNYVNISIDV